MNERLPAGAYELLHTRALGAVPHPSPQFGEVEPAEAPEVLARHVADAVRRPTSSATVFLQQLGRGLRRTPGKAVLTVLDFIGQHRREYRFDLRYRALTGTSRSRLRHEIEHGFPFLPSGSQLVLDRVARGIVLGNVRGALSRSRRELVADLRSHGDLPLAEFLSESGRELADVYGRPGQSWTGLRRETELPTLPAGSDEDALRRRVVALSPVKDPEQAALYTRLAAADGPSYGDGLARLRAHPAVVAEIGELLALTTDRARHIPRPLSIPGVTLLSHASYRREEVLAGIGWAKWERKPHGRAAGVAWAPETGGGRAAGDTAQGGARLLTHHPISRLPARGGPVPLGVPEQHVPRLDHRPPLPRGRKSGGSVRARSAPRRPGFGAIPVLGRSNAGGALRRTADRDHLETAPPDAA